MMPNNVIPVDLGLHRLIEMHRESLSETQYDIVFRTLGGKISGAFERESTPVSTGGLIRHRMPRRGGTYSLQIFGQQVQLHSLKDVLKHAILKAEEETPGFIEKLSQHRTSRGRRIVARKPDEIYPGNPELVKNCAEKLDNKWWYDTNISNDQCRRYLGVIANVGDFKDLKLRP